MFAWRGQVADRRGRTPSVRDGRSTPPLRCFPTNHPPYVTTRPAARARVVERRSGRRARGFEPSSHRSAPKDPCRLGGPGASMWETGASAYEGFSACPPRISNVEADRHPRRDPIKYYFDGNPKAVTPGRKNDRGSLGPFFRRTTKGFHEPRRRYTPRPAGASPVVSTGFWYGFAGSNPPPHQRSHDSVLEQCHSLMVSTGLDRASFSADRGDDAETAAMALRHQTANVRCICGQPFSSRASVAPIVIRRLPDRIAAQSCFQKSTDGPASARTPFERWLDACWARLRQA